MTTLRDELSEERAAELIEKYDGIELTTKDKISLLKDIGTESALRLASIIENPPTIQSSNIKPRKPLQSYYRGKLYKLMLKM